MLVPTAPVLTVQVPTGIAPAPAAAPKPKATRKSAPREKVSVPVRRTAEESRTTGRESSEDGSTESSSESGDE